MILRAVILFLLFIVIMAMLQKALTGRRSRLTSMDRLRCPDCRRVNLSTKPTRCARKDCRYK